MQFRLVKREDGLYEPFDDETIENGKKLTTGKYFVADIKMGRDYTNHKRWFVFVKHTFNMQDMYNDIEVWRGCLQIAGGHCKVVVDRIGNSHIWPGSIAWSVFDDEVKFKAMFKRSVSWFLKEHGKGMTEDELLRIIDFEPFG